MTSSTRAGGWRMAMDKTLRGKVLWTFPPRLEIPQKRRDSHLPTATAATAVTHDNYVSGNILFEATR